MIVNKYKIVLPENDQYLNIPLEMNWDFLGRDDSIEEYQTTMVKEVVGGVNDFEVLQFSHNEYVDNLNFERTNINYEFYFYDNVVPITSPLVNSTNWNNSYLDEGFTVDEVYYFTKPFTNSFFNTLRSSVTLSTSAFNFSVSWCSDGTKPSITACRRCCVSSSALVATSKKPKILLYSAIILITL